jgi:hypothetical protein
MARKIAHGRHKSDKDADLCAATVSANAFVPPASNTLGDGSQINLTDILRRRLTWIDASNGVSCGERVIEVLITAALNGNLRALQDILDRVEADAPPPLPGAGAFMSLPEFDEYRARKILEAARDDDDDQPVD